MQILTCHAWINLTISENLHFVIYRKIISIRKPTKIRKFYPLKLHNMLRTLQQDFNQNFDYNEYQK